MHEFEFAELHGLNFHEFNDSLKLRKCTVDVCGGDPYAGLLLEYLLHRHQGFYDDFEYARELPSGSNSLEDAYHKGLLDIDIDMDAIQEATLGILRPYVIRKAEKELKSLNFLRMRGPVAPKYRLNLGGLLRAYESKRAAL